MIALAKFFSYVIGFRRVVVLAIGSVRKGAVDDRRLYIFGYFFHNFSPGGADSLFPTYRTQTEK